MRTWVLAVFFTLNLALFVVAAQQAIDSPTSPAQQTMQQKSEER